MIVSNCREAVGGRGCVSWGPTGRRWRSANDRQGRRRNGQDARRRRRDVKLREREEGQDGDGEPRAWRHWGKGDWR